MKKIGLGVVLAFSLGMAGPASAQNGWSLTDVYRLASDHPSVKAARAGRDAAGYSVGDAWFGLAPRAQLLHERQRVRQEVVSTENPVYQTGVGNYGNYGRTLEVVWPIFDARNFAQLGAAYAAARRSGHIRSLAEQKMVYSTIEAYLLTLAALDSFRLATAEVRALQERSRDIGARLERGLGNESERDEADARLARAQSQEIAAAAAVGEAFAALRRVTGEDVGSLYTLRTGFPMLRPDPGSAEAWVAAAFDGNPELRALQENSVEAKYQVGKAIGQNLPRLDMRYTENYLDSGGSLYGGGARTDERNMSLRLTVPLFNPDGQGYPMFAAKEKYSESKYNLDDRRRTIEEKVRTAYLEILSNATRDAVLVRGAALQRKLTMSLRERFRAGLGTSTAILDAERDYFRAEREVLSGRYNYLLNMMQLKQLSGLISVGDIGYVNSLLNTRGKPVGRVVLR